MQLKKSNQTQKINHLKSDIIHYSMPEDEEYHYWKGKLHHEVQHFILSQSKLLIPMCKLSSTNENSTQNSITFLTFPLKQKPISDVSDTFNRFMIKKF